MSALPARLICDTQDPHHSIASFQLGLINQYGIKETSYSFITRLHIKNVTKLCVQQINELG